MYRKERTDFYFLTTGACRLLDEHYKEWEGTAPYCPYLGRCGKFSQQLCLFKPLFRRKILIYIFKDTGEPGDKETLRLLWTWFRIQNLSDQGLWDRSRYRFRSFLYLMEHTVQHFHIRPDPDPSSTLRKTRCNNHPNCPKHFTFAPKTCT